jgi:hypothetical protein
MLTPVGMRELNDALVDDRIGFVNTRIEEYMYRTSLDIVRDGGDVIVNTSLINKDDYDQVAQILKESFDAGYTISSRVLVVDEKEELGSLKVPAGCLCIATLCSITLDGMLMKKGIPANTSFAGVVEVIEGRAIEFTDLIAYAGSSLDPMRVFMARRVTRAADAIFKGRGRLLANVREVPLAAAEHARELLSQARSRGLCGLIEIGMPGEPILGCPISSGRQGIAIYAGVNGIAAAEEMGIKIKTLPISALVDFARMREL